MTLKTSRMQMMHPAKQSQYFQFSTIGKIGILGVSETLELSSLGMELFVGVLNTTSLELQPSSDALGALAHSI